MRPKVLVDPCPWARDTDWERLARTVEPVAVPGEARLTEEQLIAALESCRGLIRLGSRLPAVTRRVLEAAPDLEIVALRGDRFGTTVDLAAAFERGVRVVDVDNIASSGPVAEWVLALILLCLRNGGELLRRMITGTEAWARTGKEEFVSGELTGRRVGLIGCGHVGQRLIELLEPFRVDLVVSDPYLAPDQVTRLGIECDTLEKVLEHAEILVVQVPLTPRTTHLIGARELALLGRGKILINASRGRVLDQKALLAALRDGALIAGLDVFDPEPLPTGSPLRELPNVFLSPHIAWHAPNALHRYFEFAAQEVERFFRGETLEYELTERMVAIRHGVV
jgi:D-3-phosphoglycerate dehydrogenase / 2-oxoglutarate reductase